MKFIYFVIQCSAMAHPYQRSDMVSNKILKTDSRGTQIGDVPIC